MKKIVLLYLFAYCLIEETKSQGLKVTSNLGIVLGETKFLKKNMLYSELQISYEHLLSKEYGLSIGIGQSSISFDYYDQFVNSIYNDRTYLNVPIILTKNFKSETPKKIILNAGIGVVSSWCLKDRKTIKSFQGSTKEVLKNTGFNFSILFEVGSQYFINQNSSIKISLQPQVDIITIYSNEMEKIMLIKNLFSFSYYKQINNKAKYK